MKLLTALSQLSGIPVDKFIDQIHGTAKEATGNIYHGPTSTTPLSEASFPGAGTGTVGGWFQQSDARLALSQYNGSAVFIRSGNWEGLLSPFNDGQYAKGTMMHEVLHKSQFGFDPRDYRHTWFSEALTKAGLSGDFTGARNRESDILGRLCF